MLHAAINDCYVDIYGVKPNDLIIQQIINDIPSDIDWLGISWGYSDTEFRDELYGWMETQYNRNAKTK